MTREDAHKRFRNADMNIKWSDFDLEYQRLLDDIFDDFEKQLSSNSLQLKKENENLHNAWVDCVERYESVLNKQIIKDNKTCEGCKHYLELIESASETRCCTLYFDCIRKYVPKDRWESKE